jgi:hypothetical protein
MSAWSSVLVCLLRTTYNSGRLMRGLACRSVEKLRFGMDTVHTQVDVVFFCVLSHAEEVRHISDVV